MAQQFTNYGQSFLNGAINNSVVSLVTVSNVFFPSTGNFVIRIDDELMLVTAVSSNTFTVTRAYGGSSAASHSDGATLTEVVNVESLDTWLSQNRLYDTEANRPAAGVPGRVFVASDGHTISIDNGSSWDYFGPIVSGLTPPIDGDFTWVNQSTATVDATKGGVILTSVATAGTNMRLRYKAKSAPYKITMHFAPYLSAPSGSNFPSCGIGFTDGTKLFEIHLINSGGVHYLETLKYTNVTTTSTEPTLFQNSNFGGKCNWLQIEDDNTNLHFRYSTNGKVWLQAYQESRTSFMGSGPTGAYFSANAWNTTWDASIHVYHWLEE